jgi:hypothetical protein
MALVRLSGVFPVVVRQRWTTKNATKRYAPSVYAGARTERPPSPSTDAGLKAGLLGK